MSMSLARTYPSSTCIQTKTLDFHPRSRRELLEGSVWNDNDYNDFDVCTFCGGVLSRCRHDRPPPRSHPRLLGPTTRPAATSRKTLQQAKSNADPAKRKDEMESIDAGTLPATATATLPENPYFFPGEGMTIADVHSNGDLPQLEQATQPYSDAPQTPHPVSNAQQGDALDIRPETPSTERVATILANGPLHVPGDLQAMTEDPIADAMTTAYGYAVNSSGMDQLGGEAESWSVEDVPVDRNSQGFAKLMFPDGDYIVTTHDVIVGRNMEVARQWKKYQRDKKREERREQVPPARKELAQRDLEMYQQEPSQPSLPGDDGQQLGASNSSHSLEGRPAAQATFSETGGALAFAQDSDDEALGRRGRKKRRSVQYSKSSTSTTSVVPANLHPPVMTAEYSHYELLNENGEPYQRTVAMLPIHTQRPEDINKISKEHLMFAFNFQDECWELFVKGTGAFVNEIFVEREHVVPLGHNDEIQISSVTITFKLPDSHRHSPGLSRGTFSQVGLNDIDDSSAGEEAVATSPVRRLSNAFEDAASSDGEPAERKKGVHKLKLKGIKKVQKDKKPTNSKQKVQEDEKPAPKISLKKQQRRQSDESPAPDTEKKAEKGKKPKESAKEPAEAKVVQSIETPPAPPVFTAEPGSALASVPLDELPQKRKGPGRPPKNGLVSKRDQALVRKKERDFEKAGLEPPAFNKMLEMVRAETKQKELHAKMQSGALPPGTEIPQAVEMDLVAAAVKTPSAPAPPGNGEQTTNAPAESMRRQSSPRPKRVARSPSPMKPENSYTEEDLKKPSATYVHILDEILRDHPSGQADLQEIYDRIQKRYPYYKYRVTTQGWQSSVRHNLLSAGRFKETGRSGKGKLWTIDHDVPLDREKKKKPTPPPRPPMMNGQYMQYGQQPYGNGYGAQANGQRPVNGGPGYYSPYGQGQHGQHPAGQGMPNRQGPSPAGQPPPNGGQAQQQANPFGGLVPEILELRNAFLAPYTNQPNMQTKSDWVGNCITSFSNRFHESGEVSAVTPETPDEKQVYADLDSLFQKYEALKAKQQQEQRDAVSASSGTTAPAQATANTQAGPSQIRPPPPPQQQQQQQQTIQTAVADGVAYQTANTGPSLTASQPPAASAATSQGVAPLPPGQQNSAATSGYAGGYASSSAQRVPPPAAASGTSGTSGPSPAVAQGVPASAGSLAQSNVYAPTPGGVQSGLQQGSSHTANSNNAATPSGAAHPSPQPPQTASTQPPPRGDVKAATSVSPVVGHAPNHPPQPNPAAAVSQNEAKTSGPAPPVQPAPITESAGTKRAAEDEAPAENDAKRTKVEE